MTERKELGLAFKVLERVGKFEESLKGCRPELGLEDGQEVERVSAEYFVLRTALVGEACPISYSSLLT